MHRAVSYLTMVVCAGTLIAMAAAVPVAQQPQQQPQTQGQKPASSGTQAATVDLDELEDNPDKFLGKTVVVEGEVDRVLSPHLFTIDERNWADAERELPVVVPEPFAAIVQSDTPVRVTGTVQKVPIAQVEREWGVLGNEPKIRADIETRPELLATEVTANTKAAVTLRLRTDQPVGTAGTAGSGSSAPITETGQVAQARDKSLVGRRVDLKDASVTGVSEPGFWISLPSGERIFVLPAQKTAVRQGQTAAIRGVVLELPEGLRIKVNAKDEPVYIYADSVAAR
jgi:hypothetical protein